MDSDDWTAGPGPKMPTGPRAFPQQGVNSLASTGARAGARLIDLLMVGLPSLMVASAVQMAINGVDAELEPTAASHVALLAPLALVFVIYETIGLTRWGQTVGKFLFGIRVARQINGRCPLWWQSALRVGLVALVAVVPHPLALMVAMGLLLTGSFDPLRRNAADRAAGTVVVVAR